MHYTYKCKKARKILSCINLYSLDIFLRIFEFSDTKPPTGYKKVFWHIALQVNKAKERFKKLLDKAKFIRNKLRANKVAPIQSK